MMDEEKMKEMKEKMVEKLKEMGIDPEKINERSMHLAKKVFFKVMKLRLMLDEAGIEEEKAKKLVEKLTTMAMEKDLAKIKEWKKEHKDDEEHHCHCHCCYHHDD